MIVGSLMRRIWRTRILCLFTERAVCFFSFMGWGVWHGGWRSEYIRYDTRGWRPDRRFI